MKADQEENSAFAFRLSKEKIKEFRGYSAEDKLDWLEEANKFVADFVPEKKLRRWKNFINAGQ
jgi:hypothetical protein